MLNEPGLSNEQRQMYGFSKAVESTYSTQIEQIPTPTNLVMTMAFFLTRCNERGQAKHFLRDVVFKCGTKIQKLIQTRGRVEFVNH